VIRARRPSWPGFVLGVVLIWALFLPSADQRGVTVDPRPPLALLIVVALLAFTALARRRVPAWVRWVFGATILLLAALQFGGGKVEQILDRPLDLYFDLRHVPNLLGLYLGAAGARGYALIAALILAALLIFLLVERSLLAIDRAMQRPDTAARLLLTALVGLVLIAAPIGDKGVINTGAVTEAAQQAGSAWRAFAVLHGLDHRYDAAFATPQPSFGPLPGLKGHDVYLIFVESYGTVALDEPSYRKMLTPALDDFAASVQAAGFQLVSSRLLSPTYGGGSWLAHGTLASGVKLDQLLNELILNGDRKSLPRYMSAAGYRTVEVMPGIKKPSPEGTFWGFDAHYFAAELDYRGPEFGWFDVPDQYTLAQFAARELAPGHGPLFAQLVLVSSHTPFAPVPPYLTDWSDAGTYATIPQGDWTKIYTPPDWNDLDSAYLASIAYDLKTLSTWLARLEGSPVVVILGDHQPPELTTGTDHPWTVPIYVLARNPDLVKPFVALGYGPGPDPPPQANPEGMEKFLGEFLDGYGVSAAPPASALQQTPSAQAASRP
jgi:sulfatase-like protein